MHAHETKQSYSSYMYDNIDQFSLYTCSLCIYVAMCVEVLLQNASAEINKE